MDDGDVDTPGMEACGGFEAKKAATDDDGAFALPKRHHTLGVFEVAIGDDAVEIMPGEGDHEGVGSGGDDELVVVGHLAGL